MLSGGGAGGIPTAQIYALPLRSNLVPAAVGLFVRLFFAVGCLFGMKID